MNKPMRIVSPYIETIARGFWNRSRQKGQPPYDIVGAISLLLPIDIVSLSELTLSKINNWLAENKIKIPLEVSDRYLHGFILISSGLGFMFVNGTDDEEERRYTIAHEASHFILDYKIPRDKAIEKLGKSVLDVLNGSRNPTVNEQIDGFIKGVAPRPFTHLLEKEGDGSFTNVNIFEAENNADMLAIELLAPYSEVVKITMAGQTKLSFSSFYQRCRNILITDYRLPGSIAEQYSKQIAYSETGRPSIIAKLGF